MGGGSDFQVPPARGQQPLKGWQSGQRSTRLVSGQRRLGGAGSGGQVDLGKIRAKPRLTDGLGD